MNVSEIIESDSESLRIVIILEVLDCLYANEQRRRVIDSFGGVVQIVIVDFLQPRNILAKLREFLARVMEVVASIRFILYDEKYILLLWLHSVMVILILLRLLVRWVRIEEERGDQPDFIDEIRHGNFNEFRECLRVINDNHDAEDKHNEIEHRIRHEDIRKVRLHFGEFLHHFAFAEIVHEDERVGKGGGTRTHAVWLVWNRDRNQETVLLFTLLLELESIHVL